MYVCMYEYMYMIRYNNDGNIPFEESNGDYYQAPCDNPRLSDPSFKAIDRWGCPYDAERDSDKLNFENPPLMDTVGIPPYSWVYIRYIANTPGAWSFHCHTYDHTLRGMKMVLNVQPENQPEPPETALKCGPCGGPSILAGSEQCPVDLYSGSEGSENCGGECEMTWSREHDDCEGDRLSCLSLCSDNDEECTLNCDILSTYCTVVAEGRQDTCQALCEPETKTSSSELTDHTNTDTDDLTTF